MGLDISYYKNLKRVDCVFDADGDPIDPATRKPLAIDYMQVYVNPDFADRADGMDDKSVWTGEAGDGFRAGSYSGYSQWRNTLAEIAGYPSTPYEQYGKTTMRFDAGAWSATAGPFWELINFSDCEGVIGPKTSAKLAKDFSDFQEKAEAYGDEWFLARYNEWRAAFAAASQNGCVDFH